MNDVTSDESAEPISANPHTQFASTGRGVQPAVNTRKRQAHGQMNASELDDPDAAVTRVLYHEHAAALLRYALRLTVDRARAEDGVQETNETRCNGRDGEERSVTDSTGAPFAADSD
jgi:hypothetical protein